MTAEKLGSVEPGVVPFDGGGALGSIRITQPADAVAHDENRVHTVIFAAFLKILHVSTTGPSLGLNAESIVRLA